jgi:hypothetical protein
MSVWLLTFAILISNPLFSQSLNSGAISGTVLDPVRMVVPQAFIELRNFTLGITDPFFNPVCVGPGERLALLGIKDASQCGSWTTVAKV